MSHNFKPGDLALTLKAGYGIAVMTTVQLEMFLGKGQKAQEPDGQLWTAPFDGWVVGRDGEDGFGFFKASYLMPLRGDFTPEQHKSQEVTA
jgi:hypothetical protein